METVNNHHFSSRELLGENGPFAQASSGFLPRPGQQQMADFIEQAIGQEETIAVEAPSGSGKTLGYLVPAIKSGKKIIVSTTTHALQQQLCQRDMVAVNQALGLAVKPVLLKGRSNYLCPAQLEKQLARGKFKQGSIQTALTLVAQRFREQQIGDLALIASDINQQCLPLLTISPEECTTTQCTHYLQCPFYQQQKRAKQSRLVVINHHLLVSDVFRELVDDETVVIVDEAHRLVEISQTLTSRTLSSYQLHCWIKASQQVLSEFSPEYQSVGEYLQKFDALLDNWRQQLPVDSRYKAEQHKAVAHRLEQWLLGLLPWLQAQKPRAGRFRELLCQLENLLHSLRQVQAGGGLCFAENRGKGFVVQQIAPSFAAVRASLPEAGSWIFTSATLSVAGNPEPSLRLLGLTTDHYRQVDSELNYANRSLLYTPRLTVSPEQAGYIYDFGEHLIAFLRQLSGRALLLFSSHRVLQQLAQRLKTETDFDGKLLVQGEGNHQQLIDQLGRDPQGILLGTGSFWEGVDMGGIPLRAVVIDKLPFASPDDPVLKLRSHYLQDQGVDSFNHLLLPDAVIRLRQGYGRLLRRVSDKGVIMLADPRLDTKPYGQVFIDSLPAMGRVDELEAVEAFLNTHETDDVIGY